MKSGRRIVSSRISGWQRESSTKRSLLASIRTVSECAVIRPTRFRSASCSKEFKRIFNGFRNDSSPKSSRPVRIQALSISAASSSLMKGKPLFRKTRLVVLSIARGFEAKRRPRFAKEANPVKVRAPPFGLRLCPETLSMKGHASKKGTKSQMHLLL